MAAAVTPRPPRSPFVVPRGTTGRLAGRLMARTNESAQREVAARLPVRPGDRVVEVGYGPGRLLRRLLDTTAAAHVAGVDPSGAMLVQAGGATRRYELTGRIDLRLGVAADLPWSDGAFDHAVTVDTVQAWPDLVAGLAEMRRVLRPGGTALVATPSPTSPAPAQRVRALAEDRLDALARGMADVFGRTEREDLGHVLAFLATR